MTTVLIVDDEPLVRAGVRVILGSDARVEVVGEAATGREAVDMVLRHRPAVVLMDIRMPELDGLSAIEEIRRHLPSQRVIVFTTYGESGYIARAVEIGVDGFLTKSGDPHDLLAGIAAVADGGACLSPAVTAYVLSALQRDDPVRTADAGAAVTALSPRERDVLRLVAAGRSNAEIATELFLGHGTVKGYVSSILTRLGVRNRVEAAVVAWEASRREHL